MKAEFINEVIERLQYQNEYERYDKKQLDIPFIIAGVDKLLDKKECKDFIEDFTKYKVYINYVDVDEEDGRVYGRFDINLVDMRCCEGCVKFTDEDEYSCRYCDEQKDDIAYEYSINLITDCDPNSDDVPICQLNKVIPIICKHWNWSEDGDIDEYRKKFYENQKELAEEQEKREKEDKIKMLNAQIKANLEELKQLES